MSKIGDFVIGLAEMRMKGLSDEQIVRIVGAEYKDWIHCDVVNNTIAVCKEIDAKIAREKRVRVV